MSIYLRCGKYLIDNFPWLCFNTATDVKQNKFIWHLLCRFLFDNYLFIGSYYFYIFYVAQYSSVLLIHIPWRLPEALEMPLCRINICKNHGFPDEITYTTFLTGNARRYDSIITQSTFVPNFYDFKTLVQK